MMKNKKIAIIGLGYVGLPLAMEFDKSKEVVGFDIDTKRIEELQNNNDTTFEVTSKELKNLKNTIFTNELSDIKECLIYIITVPTQVNIDKGPILIPLKFAVFPLTSIVKESMKKVPVCVEV